MIFFGWLLWPSLIFLAASLFSWAFCYEEYKEAHRRLDLSPVYFFPLAVVWAWILLNWIVVISYADEAKFTTEAKIATCVYSSLEDPEVKNSKEVMYACFGDKSIGEALTTIEREKKFDKAREERHRQQQEKLAKE